MYMLHFSLQSSSSIKKSLTQQKSSQGADPFYWMRVILASNRGTLMEPEISVQGAGWRFGIQPPRLAWNLNTEHVGLEDDFPLPAV